MKTKYWSIPAPHYSRQGQTNTKDQSCWVCFLFSINMLWKMLKVFLASTINLCNLELTLTQCISINGQWRWKVRDVRRKWKELEVVARFTAIFHFKFTSSFQIQCLFIRGNIQIFPQFLKSSNNQSVRWMKNSYQGYVLQSTRTCSQYTPLLQSMFVILSTV